MASSGSDLPGGFVLGAMSHADRVGLIYEARDQEGRRVAAQVLHPLHVDELRAWFEANATLGQTLQHPNLVRVFAVGETDNGLPVKVTERVEGRTLRARIAAGDLLVGAELARVVRAVADALDYLHTRPDPVLHLALMPENVVCTVEGAVKLVAVGYADCPRNPPTKATYRAPEDLRDAALSPQSDVFSLASLTYELITGRPAFPGSVEAIVDAVQRGVLPLVGVVHSNGLAPLNRVLHRAWAASPRERTPRAGTFANELDDALRLVPTALLGVRRGPQDLSARNPPSQGPSRLSSQAPPAMQMRQSTPAFGRPPVQAMPPASGRQPTPSPASPAVQMRQSTPPVGRPPARSTLAARLLTPFPAPVSVNRSASAIYALPPPPRLPTGLPAPPPELKSEPIELTPSRRLRGERASNVPPEAPSSMPPSAPSEAPRTRIDTDDAVLILEPALVDAAELPPLDEALPPLESVIPEDDSPDLQFGDECEPAPIVRQSVRVAGAFIAREESPPAPVVEPVISAPAVALMVPPPKTVEARRVSWSTWRPEVIERPEEKEWHRQEMRITPRVVGMIIAANVLFTVILVGALMLLLRR